MVDEKQPQPKPGTILDYGKPSSRKVPWTYKDMEVYPKKTFTPEETMKVTVHGLTYQLLADQEITVPSIVYEEYAKYRKAMRDQSTIIMTNMGPVTKTPGAGGLEPEQFVKK